MVAGNSGEFGDTGGVREFTVASTALKTAFARGANGTRPTPSSNTIQLNGQKCEVHWVELSFGAMSPYVLVHGKGADARFWEAEAPGNPAVCWPRFNDLLRSKEIPFDSSISLKGLRTDVSQDTVANQAGDLQLQIVPVVASFGTRHLNMIAHSKGGLDSRYWLTEINPYPAANGVKLVLGQYITICTPHKGSVIADLVVVGEFVSILDIEANVPCGTVSLRASGYLQVFSGIGLVADEDTPAVYCLRTNRVTPDRRVPAPALPDDTSTYNAMFGWKLPAYRSVDGSAPTFWGVRADADRDFNGVIDQDEVLEARLFAGSLAILSEINYMALGAVQSVSQPPGATFSIFGGTAKLIQPVEYGSGWFEPNDLLVTYSSAIYGPFGQTLIDPITRFDHGGIVRTSTAAQLYLRTEVMARRK